MTKICKVCGHSKGYHGKAWFESGYITASGKQVKGIKEAFCWACEEYGGHKSASWHKFEESI